MPLNSQIIDATDFSSQTLKKTIDNKAGEQSFIFCYGYKSFKTAHLPVLEKTDTPAMLFITTAYCLDGEEGYLSSQDIVQLAKHPLLTLGVTTKSGHCIQFTSPKIFWNEITKPRKILSSLTRQNFNYFYLSPHQPNRGFYKKILTLLGYQVMG